MRSTRLVLSCAALLAAVPHAAAAQQAAEQSLVSLFMEACTGEGQIGDAVLAHISELTDWTEVPDVTVDVAAMAQVPNQLMPQTAFRQPESVRQWQRTVEGKQVSLVFATFPQGSVHRNVCAIVVPEVRNAGVYLPSLREALTPMSMSARFTDLPHYQEFAGRTRDMRRVRAEIFTRSRALPTGRNTMHLYIAFD
ncbi:MAG TPA: hypothetical protein VFT45_23655 [Longimicrobium sp.]|nr:hypothetical protein [Longimicrobium sp.]